MGMNYRIFARRNNRWKIIITARTLLQLKNRLTHYVLNSKCGRLYRSDKQ